MDALASGFMSERDLKLTLSQIVEFADKIAGSKGKVRVKFHPPCEIVGSALR